MLGRGCYILGVFLLSLFALKLFCLLREVLVSLLGNVCFVLKCEVNMKMFNLEEKR